MSTDTERVMPVIMARRKYADEVRALDLALALVSRDSDRARLFERSCQAADEAHPGASGADALTRDLEAPAWARVQMTEYRRLVYGYIAEVTDRAADAAVIAEQDQSAVLHAAARDAAERHTAARAAVRAIEQEAGS